MKFVFCKITQVRDVVEGVWHSDSSKVYLIDNALAKFVLNEAEVKLITELFTLPIERAFRPKAENDL